MKINSLQIMRFCALMFFTLLTFGGAKAAYDCAYNVTSAGLPACCYPANLEPLEGISCRPEGQFLQKIGNNAPTCKDAAGLLNLASQAAAKNFIGFNCFSDSLNRTCQNPSTQCLNPTTDACQTFAGPNPICTAAHKTTNCDQSCGSCSSGYISCGGTCQTPLVGTCTGGYTWDQCTGTCSCPEGTTPSGLTANTCISYFSRFAEILSYGLAVLGGPAKNGVYDYSVTNPIDYMRNVYLKSDVSESLNWKSSSLPAPFKWLLSNYNLCTVDADCPGTGKKCSEGGLCYTPAAVVGNSCSNDSDCNIIQGLSCDPKTKTCYITPPNTPPSISMTARFIGLTASTYDGNRGGYSAVNTLCNNSYEGSHVCSSQELINTYINYPSYLTGVTDIAWINIAAPGNIEPLVNDCNGWLDNSDFPYFATVWNFNIKSGAIQSCSSSKKYACCK